MNSEGLGEMFEGDSADMRAGKFPLTSMSGRAEGQADPGARTPIFVSGNFMQSYLTTNYKMHDEQEGSSLGILVNPCI